MKALAWALGLKAPTPDCKLALILMADMAGRSGFVAMEGMAETLASQSSMSLARANRTIQRLLNGHFLSIRSGTVDGFSTVLGYRFPDEAIDPYFIEEYRSYWSPTRGGPKKNPKREAVFARDGYACVYCGDTNADGFELDHVVPLCQGGSSTQDNLATSCTSCNRKKRGRTPEQWRAAQ